MAVLFCLAAFEVNFMDDVGQTLLNWASAFGTQEMVRSLLVALMWHDAVEFIFQHHANCQQHLHCPKPFEG